MIGDLAHEILLSAPGPNWPFRFRVGLGLGLGLGLSTIAKYCSICIILLIYLHEKKSFTLLPESLNGEVKLVPHHLEEVLHMWAGDVIIETLLILPPLQLQEGDLPRVPRVLLIDVKTDESGTVLLIHHGKKLHYWINVRLQIYRYLSIHFGDFPNKLPLVLFVFKSEFCRHKKLSF